MNWNECDRRERRREREKLHEKEERERERQRPVWTLIGKVSLGHGEKRPRKGVRHTGPFKGAGEKIAYPPRELWMTESFARLPTLRLSLLATVALWTRGDWCYEGKRGSDMARGLKHWTAPARIILPLHYYHKQCHDFFVKLPVTKLPLCSFFGINHKN